MFDVHLLDLLDRLQPVKSAFHDAHGAAPACLEGTRTQLLDEISVWMADPSAKLVYWLTGVAGTGKTTIAQSVASMAKKRKCLAATFFFSRTGGSADRRRAAAVIPTIAYQLAYRYEVLRDCICGATSTDRDVSERYVAMQAKTLLVDALGSSRQALPLPLVIVLDALDECDKENGREGGDLIPILLHSLEKLSFNIKIFVTSRPEPSIKNMFSRADIHGSTVGLALHRDIEQSIVREDIGRYLRHEFDKLAHERFVPPPFPLETDLQTLVDRAGNLFIYVRTIVMYVSSDVEDPINQLADVLRADADRASEQFADLDVLYTQILSKALDGVGRSAAAQRQLRDVLASLVLVQESLPASALAVVAGVEERQCKRILLCLSSVLLYEHTSDEPVRLMHPSFLDFLTCEGRCSDARYFIGGAEYHSMLALRCLQIMNADLRRNICNLQDPFIPNSNILDLEQRLDRNTSAQLQYACKYWHVHVQSAGCFHPDLITALDVFCTKHLLHWLELLSLMKEVPVALRDLPTLLSYLEVRTIC
jgi:Mrp family chromosome partitioning ATPase